MPKPIHTETLPSGPSFEMIPIEGGEFRMGGQDDEAFDDEKPVHQVKVPAFYMGKYPVTQALWVAVMGDNPSSFKGPDRPVEQVSWRDTRKFIQKLNAQIGQTYRLPTEAEWEYAARGGRGRYKYAGSDKLKEVGWYIDISHRETKVVGQKDPNELGLYDMSGNVWEWVEDHWHDNYEGAPADGSAWVDQKDKNARRGLRGGSWYHDPRNCRVSFRITGDPGSRVDIFGFRLVLPSSQVG